MNRQSTCGTACMHIKFFWQISKSCSIFKIQNWQSSLLLKIPMCWYFVKFCYINAKTSEVALQLSYLKMHGIHPNTFMWWAFLHSSAKLNTGQGKGFLFACELACEHQCCPVQCRDQPTGSTVRLFAIKQAAMPPSGPENSRNEMIVRLPQSRRPAALTQAISIGPSHPHSRCGVWSVRPLLGKTHRENQEKFGTIPINRA